MGRYTYDLFRTDLGWVGLLGSERGLRATTLPVPTREAALAALGPEAVAARHDPAALADAREAVVAALEGRQGGPGVRLDLEGAPPFFRAAWEACRTIPRGETRSYGWLARAAGRPEAARAAGQAMARNRLAPLVPCHRVVAGDGRLGGYGGGLPLKERLLSLEAGPTR